MKQYKEKNVKYKTFFKNNDEKIGNEVIKYKVYRHTKRNGESKIKYC